MVKLNKIYTRTGDDGTTGLGTGARVAKHASRIAAYGAVDEANACIGLARLSTADPALEEIDQMLERIQNDLFDLGADLCTPDTGTDPGYEPLRIVPEQVVRLETEIDKLNDALQPLKTFVLPGGSAASAALHLCRTVSRRAERLMVKLNSEPDEQVSDAALQYVNRLSDLFFVVARYCNDKGDGDVLWVPGANR